MHLLCGNRKIVIVFAMMFLISTFAFAQKNTGAIEGTINDNEDRPIPGVAVTASSPSLIGGRATVYSDQQGYYRFPHLSSGLYQVQAELQGFQTLIQKDVDLSVGQTLRVNFTLQITAVTETVDVTEKPPLIDVTTPAVSFTVPAEIIHNLPERQNIKDLLALTPGVDDELNAYGSDGAKANTISIDGVTMSDSRASSAFDLRGATRLLLVEYNYNWLEEVQVAGIGAPAELGGFTGVSGNFTMRSGSNQFHGLVETFFQNEKLTSSNVPNPAPELPFKAYDISAQLGGPILRDRFWFFSGLQVPHTETQPFGFDGVITDAQTKFITKLTYRLNQNNTLQGFVNRNYGSIENAGAGTNVLPEATTTTKSSQWSGNASWISLLGSHTNFEVRYGGLYDNYYDDEDRPDVSGHLDLATGISSVNAAVRFSSERVRHQVNAVLSHYASDFLKGEHDFRFGVQFERSHSVEDYNFNGGAGYQDYLGAPYSRSIIHNAGLDGSNHRTSVYAQDEWNLSDRIRLSLGARWDHNRGITDRGVVFATDPVSPRLGLVWNVEKETQTVMKAHYGDYYDALLEGHYHFLSDRITTAIVEAYNAGQWEEVFNNHRIFLSDDHLKHPFVRQFSIGLDRVLVGEIPFGAHYIYRRFGNILEDVGNGPFVPVPFVNPLDGETATVFDLTGPEEELVLTNPSGLYRRYDGLEFYASKQVAARFSVGASFVYSRLRGNAPGGNVTGSATSPFLNNPNSLIHFPGRLKNDPTFAWKVVGSFTLPWGINTGMYFRHSSGDTWNATVRVRGLRFVTFPPQRINAEPAGSRRLPSENLLDLRLEKEFPFYGGQLRFTMDIFNVFNRAYATRINTFFEAPNFGMPLQFSAPRQIRLGVRYTF